MKARTDTLPSIDRVRELLEFDGRTVRWKKHSGRASVGYIAGNCCHPDGRWRIAIDRRLIARSWIVWALANGRWPTEELDHISRDNADDRIENLREATRSQQNGNRWMPNNSSGARAVQFEPRKKKWTVRIALNGKRKRYGMFDSLEKATAVANTVGKELYGDYWIVTKVGLQ